MVKLSGGSRVLKSGSRNYNKREVEYRQLMASGDYSGGYFSAKSGGYYVIENSPATHKPEEIEAARIMANQGYKVKLKDESGEVRTPDGEIFNVGFEQSTPSGESESVNNFKNALEHARDKPNAKAAVVYMKYANHTRETIGKAIDKYSQYNSKKLDVFVVTRDGRIHRWRTHE